MALVIACYGYFDLSELADKETHFKPYMVAHIYGAIIGAFPAGIQWAVSFDQRNNRDCFILINVPATTVSLRLFSFANFVDVVTIFLFFFGFIG